MPTVPTDRSAPAKPRSDLNLSRFAERLEAERARLSEQIQRLSENDQTVGSGERTELADYDQHQADEGTDLFLREQDQAINEGLQSELDLVTSAMRKMEQGTYGYCDRCGAEIPKARLEVLPGAIFCMECASFV